MCLLKDITDKILRGLFISLLIALAGASGACAQAPGLARVSPETASLEVGGEVTLSLEALGAEDVNAYDVTLTYDPAVVTLLGWSHGGFLSNLAQVYQIDKPGTLRLVFTQLATPPVSGDGVLLELVFGGVAPGESAVTIERLDFAGASGGIINPELRPGLLRVLPVPADSPTPTETAPPAATRTPSPQPTAASTAAGQPPDASPLPTRVNRVTIMPPRESAVSGPPASPTPASPQVSAAQSSAPAGVFLPAVESSAAGTAQAPAGSRYQLVNTLLWILLGGLAALILWMAARLVQRSRNKP